LHQVTTATAMPRVKKSSSSSIKDQGQLYDPRYFFPTLPLLFNSTTFFCLCLFSLFKKLTMKQRKNIERVSSFGNIIASSVFIHDDFAIASNDSNCDVKTKKNKERE
jgi:hypothetical protein